ncbi:hypothetical protein EX30DRAFT_346378 [Ascodesmis nigricans]|uniref:Uncharacterized protein n=1 Tax=Ascodesmis nigricans TaxID=341454 RepID=A0A4S2N309_9PEZI|nr:hypothetical protein EX30DRAFT_346378 [Ascodesmis nigricans]
MLQDEEAPSSETAQDEEAAIKNSQVGVNAPEECDLFGIRAIESGFFGGIPQSRPSTPTTPSLASSSTSVHRIPYGKPPSPPSQEGVPIDYGASPSASRNTFRNGDPDAIQEIVPLSFPHQGYLRASPKPILQPSFDNSAPRRPEGVHDGLRIHAPEPYRRSPLAFQPQSPYSQTPRSSEELYGFQNSGNLPTLEELKEPPGPSKHTIIPPGTLSIALEPPKETQPVEERFRDSGKFLCPSFPLKPSNVNSFIACPSSEASSISGMSIDDAEVLRAGRCQVITGNVEILDSKRLNVGKDDMGQKPTPHNWSNSPNPQYTALHASENFTPHAITI